MTTGKREHTLGIWALTVGYYLFYVPYSGISKAVTSGMFTGGQSIPGTELLPAAGISTAITVLLFITAMRWWKYACQRRVFGLNVIVPRRQTLISGIGFSIIIFTTTLAYSFSGISILLALILMRAGVLIISPIIDRFFNRRIRWFSWVGLVLSLVALAISLTSVHEYQLSFAALLNLAAYLSGHALRIPAMTQIAKTGQRETALGYFVEEQAVAMLLLICFPCVVGLLGRGEIAHEFRAGFAHLVSPSIGLAGWTIGLFYAGLGICLSFIYLDRRENTFCMPLFACSSLLSGITASYLLAWWMPGLKLHGVEITAGLLLIVALLVMSPLHHLPLYIRQLRSAIAEHRLILVDFKGNSAGKPAPSWSVSSATRFITINFDAMREVLRNPPTERQP
jgi:hypothetical protein